MKIWGEHQVNLTAILMHNNGTKGTKQMSPKELQNEKTQKSIVQVWNDLTNLDVTNKLLRQQSKVTTIMLENLQNSCLILM